MDPSVGSAIAHAPCCTREEVGTAIETAAGAFPAWSDTPVFKRVQVLYRFRERVMACQEELTRLVSREHGKCWGEAEGEVLKVLEAIECPPALSHSSVCPLALFRKSCGLWSKIRSQKNVHYLFALCNLFVVFYHRRAQYKIFERIICRAQE